MTPYEFRLPDVGEGLSEAVVIEWKCAEGERVGEDDVLVIVSTDKAMIEIPSPVSGRLVRKGAEPDQVLAIGAILAVFDVEDQRDSPADLAAEQNIAAVGGDAPAGLGADSEDDEAHAVGRSRGPLASPAVRRLAAQMGVDLTGVLGSGPQGRILRSDLHRHSGATVGGAPLGHEQAATMPQALRQSHPGERVPISRMRRLTAAAVLQSWRSAPHIFDWRDADATQLLLLRETLRTGAAEREGRFSLLSIMVAIVAEALRRQPRMNVMWDESEEGLIRPNGVHIGVAVALDDGIAVPVIRDADQRSIAANREILDGLIERARRGVLAMSETTGAAFTVNNIGAVGGIYGSPILPLGQGGILGFGRVTDRVVSVHGLPEVRPMLPLSTAADHRAVDGKELCEFVELVVRLVENPFILLTARSE